MVNVFLMICLVNHYFNEVKVLHVTPEIVLLNSVIVVAQGNLFETKPYFSAYKGIYYCFNRFRDLTFVNLRNISSFHIHKLRQLYLLHYRFKLSENVPSCFLGRQITRFLKRKDKLPPFNWNLSETALFNLRCTC